MFVIIIMLLNKKCHTVYLTIDDFQWLCLYVNKL